MHPSGGVGGAILAKTKGKALAAACADAAPLERGQAVLTPSFGLPCPNIVHCRGPRYEDKNSSEALEETYWNVVELAERSGFSSIAIPAISAGAMGFPIDEAATAAIESIKNFSPALSNLRRIRFVLVDREAARVFADKLMMAPKIPINRHRLEIGTAYLPAEFDAMRRGHIGDQDTKWFFFFEDPWLCVYRGNRRYGRCHFWLRLPNSDSAACINEAWMDSEVPSAESPWKIGEAEELIKYLLDSRFHLLRVAESLECIGGATLWIKRGNIALDCSLGEGEGLLSPDDAAALGLRLLQLAESIKTTYPTRNN
jgi:O-acetyl-ADP-ribose deacetylase (regulator of RNase III)